MNRSTPAVRFLYGTAPGRVILRGLLRTRADRLAVRFLRSPLSRPMVGWYARRHGIPLTPVQRRRFRTFRDFFARRKRAAIDADRHHLISPCDGWLSVHPIDGDSSFHIKGFSYPLRELIGDEALSRRYHGGVCLIFRLEPGDYHHYCYIDDGYQGENHFIPGALHSVQPGACAAYPVYTLNRRVWTLLATEHFGPVIQTEIGALVVGGIVPARESGRFRKGGDMGRFELAGSTIALFFEQGRIKLRPELAARTALGGEVRVELGSWIGCRGERSAL